MGQFQRFAPLLVHVVTGVLLSGCAMAGARAPVSSDRPDFTDGTVVLAPGAWQLESGHSFARQGRTRLSTSGELMMRAGITPRVELRLSANSYARARRAGTTARGFEDASVGLKVRLRADGEAPSWRPGVVLLAQSTVPTGARAFRAPRAQPEVKLITRWALSDRIEFTSNVNAAYPFDGERTTLELRGSGSFAATLTRRLGVFVEAYTLAPRGVLSQGSRYVDAGLMWHVHPDVQLDVRGGVRTDTHPRDHFTGVGFVIRP